ncbi:MAG TPA: hypothetical protein VGL86_02375 [Polyangia bacterium]|jgi:hypothetical protein
MRVVTFVLLFAAGCCDPVDLTSQSPPDLSGAAAACPAGAEQSSTAKCDYGVETTCRSSFGYDCQCLCTGYWECDQVHVICDPADAGARGD